MDIILLGVTVGSLVVALVMSVVAWRVTREEKQRSAARVAALSLAMGADDEPSTVALRATADQTADKKAVVLHEAPAPQSLTGSETFGAWESSFSEEPASANRPAMRAPWAAPPATPRPSPFDSSDFATAKSASLRAVELPLNQPPVADVTRISEPSVSHASGFLGAEVTERDTGSRQRSLAFAALILFAVLAGGLGWMMSGPRGSSAVAVGPNSPLELVSLSHQRDKDKLAVSGLVRNPTAGQPVQNLSAVVFLFDRTGTFVTSSRANVDFLKLGAGDETPFVVSLDAPATVARYRVSFRTDDGVVPHVDRRSETAGSSESAVKSSVVSRQLSEKEK